MCGHLASSACMSRQNKISKEVSRFSEALGRRRATRRAARGHVVSKTNQPGSMHFCVCCGNLLQLEAVGNNMRFYCQTCPYVYKLRTRVISEVPLEHKAVDDVLGGPEAWKNADQTDAVRPCSSARKRRGIFWLLARIVTMFCVCVCVLTGAVLPKVHKSTSLLSAVRAASRSPGCEPIFVCAHAHYRLPTGYKFAPRTSR